MEKNNMRTIKISEADFYIALTALEHFRQALKDVQLKNIMSKAQQGLLDSAFANQTEADEFINRYTDYFNNQLQAESLKRRLQVVDPHVQVKVDEEGKVYQVGPDGEHTRVVQAGDVSFADDPDGYVRRGEE